MANDVYLQIDGIKGESTDHKHGGWIEVNHVQWGVHQPTSSTASTAGGLTAGRAELAELTFRKLADLSSLLLLQTCAAGKTIPKAKFEFFRADAQGERVKYFEISLEHLIIARVTPHSGESGIIEENVALAYGKIKWSYTQQKVSGGCAGNTAGGWDCTTNKILA